jgi:hypothetical protein
VERLGVDAATDVAWRTMATLLDDFLPGAK